MRWIVDAAGRGYFLLLKMPSDGVGAVVLAGVFKVLSDFEDGFDCALWYLSGVGVRGPGAWL